jgi:hypothetical protein
MHFSYRLEARMRYATLLYLCVGKGRSRSLIVTEHGRLGIAPEVALEGDIITLLLGGDAPIAL